MLSRLLEAGGRRAPFLRWSMIRMILGMRHLATSLGRYPHPAYALAATLGAGLPVRARGAAGGPRARGRVGSSV